MALLREPHLGEVADDGELLAGPRGAERQLGDGLVGRVLCRPPVDEVRVEHPLRHGGAGEVREGAAVVAAGVAVLQAAGEHGIHRRARDDAEVPGARDLAGQPPAGDGDAHAALDDRGAGAVGTAAVRVRRGRGRRGGEGLGQDGTHGSTFVVRQPTVS